MSRNHEIQHFEFSVTPTTYYRDVGEYRELTWRIVIDGKELNFKHVLDIDDGQSLLGRLFDVAQMSFEQAIKVQREEKKTRLMMNAKAMEQLMRALVCGNIQ